MSSPASTVAATPDAGGLLTKEEVAAVQGCTMTAATTSSGQSGGLRITQSFYASAEPNKSVSLAVAQADPDAAVKRTVPDFWHETFDRYAPDPDDKKESSAATHERESTDRKKPDGDADEKDDKKDPAESRKGAGPSERKETEREEEEKKNPPQRVEGLGDAAYWMNNPVGGVLYVLKGERFIRISVGGPDKPEVKLDKSKALAATALKRL